MPHADVVDTPGPTPTPTPSADRRSTTTPRPRRSWDPLHGGGRRAARRVVAPASAGAARRGAEHRRIARSPTSSCWPERGRGPARLRSSKRGLAHRSRARRAAIRGTLADAVDPAISPDGEPGRDVDRCGDPGGRRRDGRTRVVPWPPALVGPWDTRPAAAVATGRRGPRGPALGATVVGRPRGRAVDRRRSGGRNASQVMVDPDTGAIRESRWADSTLVTWDGDEVVRRVPRRGYGERFVTRYGLAAYTGSPGPGRPRRPTSGPVVRGHDDRGGRRLRADPGRELGLQRQRPPHGRWASSTRRRCCCW